jgi:Flp pilus assembly protein TadG
MTNVRSSKRGRRGQSMLEFTLVGIPIMFVLISIFEISRGMWVYHTLSYAVKEGVRYAIVHGTNCGPPSNNTCQTSIATIAQKIQDAGVGLDTGDSKTLLTFIDGGGAQTTCFLGGATNPCSGQGTTWPPAGGSPAANQVGEVIEIDIVTPFKSAIAMFWPGAQTVSFGTANLWASSSDRILF